MEAVLGEFRHGRALEGIDEADAEDVVAHLGHARIRGRRRDHRDLVVLGDGRGLEGPAGGDLAEEGDDLVAGDEFFDDGGGLALLGLVVLGDELDLASQDAAGGVQLLDGEEGALVRGLPEGGLLAGEGGEFADLDGLLGAGGAGEGRGREHGKQKGAEGFGHKGTEEGLAGREAKGRAGWFSTKLLDSVSSRRAGPRPKLSLFFYRR